MFSAADDIDDLFAMASRRWSFGQKACADRLPIPEPRDFEVLRTDPKWADRFADAEIVIAIKRLGRKGEKRPGESVFWQPALS
jgi:hypothetical protein